MIKTKFTILFVLTSIFCLACGYWIGSTYGSVSVSNVDKMINNENLQLGDTAIIHHVEVTLHQIRTERYLEEEGKQFVFVDLSVKNMREQTYDLNLHKFTLVDQNHYSYGYELHEGSKGILGGQISNGRTVRGEIAFLVPIEEQYELIFTDHLRTGQAIWTVVP